jgi:hypothetical protein
MTDETIVDKPQTQADAAAIERDSKVQAEEKQKLTAEETRAESFGWKPKEKWVEEGNAEEDWVPAKHFLKFGEVKQQLISKDKQLTKQEKIIKMMKDHHTKVRETAIQEALQKLKAERATALQENDLVRAEQIRDTIETTKEQFAKQKPLPTEIEQEIQQVEQQVQTPPAEYFEFLAQNPWYDPNVRNEMTIEAEKIGWAERAAAEAEGRPLVPKDMYKAVATKIRKLFPDKFETPKSPQSDSPSKTGSGRSTKVNLTEEQLQIAKTFGLTPEEYAKETNSYRGR